MTREYDSVYLRSVYLLICTMRNWADKFLLHPIWSKIYLCVDCERAVEVYLYQFSVKPSRKHTQWNVTRVHWSVSNNVVTWLADPTCSWFSDQWSYTVSNFDLSNQMSSSHLLYKNVDFFITETSTYTINNRVYELKCS